MPPLDLPARSHRRHHRHIDPLEATIAAGSAPTPPSLDLPATSRRHHHRHPIRPLKPREEAVARGGGGRYAATHAKEGCRCCRLWSGRAPLPPPVMRESVAAVARGRECAAAHGGEKEKESRVKVSTGNVLSKSGAILTVQ